MDTEPGEEVTIMWPFRRHSTVDKPVDPLTPGTCECGHLRCCHVAGSGVCSVGYPADKEWPDGAVCACKIFILDPNADEDDDEETPETPSPLDLEELYRK
jgi:hypothetical protein